MYDQHRQTVSRIQTRIVKAVKRGLKATARGLQRLLSNSLAAKLIAIKRIISKYFRRIKGRDWRFVEKGHSTPLILLGPTWIIRHITIKAQVNPYNSVWADYLKARWKRTQLSGVATRLINA
jgi:hypothetical protein